MAKELITVRVDTAVKDIITRLANEDDRTVSWMSERLIVEALEARGLLEGKKTKSSRP